MKSLLYVTAMRGGDSTGISTIDIFPRSKTEVIKTSKMAQDSSYFLWSDRTSKKPLLAGYNHDIIIGHCRDATVGSVTDENAHPFEIGKIVGAHNGTLVDSEFYDQEFKKTDSELMFEKMNQVGIKETLEALDGYSAYAVSIYERGSGVITLARNSKRPLFIAKVKGKDVLYWSSEQEMLEFVAARKSTRTELKIYRLLENVLYTIPFDFDKDDEDPWSSVDLEVKKTYPAAHSYSMWDNYDWVENDTSTVESATNIDCLGCNSPIYSEELADSRIMHDTGVTYICRACQKLYSVTSQEYDFTNDNEVEEEKVESEDVDESEVSTTTH